MCEAERPAFRQSVGFLEQAPNGRGLRLDDLEVRTEASDGTSATKRVNGRFVADDLGEMGLSGQVRLVRDGGEWCISGQRDGFRSVRGSPEDVFALLVRGGISRGARFEVSEDAWSTPVEGVTPRPGAPPEIEGKIVTTASGLNYIEIRPGAGPLPQPGQTLMVHYTLWLKESGKRMDSSHDRGEPFEFVLGGGVVVEGFDEGLATMRQGGERRLIVPPRLGYGDDDDYVDIPPNSTLVFDVELVAVR